MNKAIREYQQTGVHSGVHAADPHRLVQMLLQGALDRLAKAKGALSRKAVAEKGQHIGVAISIIDGLRSSLDTERGGELANNLGALYDYMERRLLLANLHDDAAIVDEVVGLLRDIHEAWVAIGPQVRGEAVAAERMVSTGV